MSEHSDNEQVYTVSSKITVRSRDFISEYRENLIEMFEVLSFAEIMTEVYSKKDREQEKTNKLFKKEFQGLGKLFKVDLNGKIVIFCPVSSNFRAAGRPTLKGIQIRNDTVSINDMIEGIAVPATDDELRQIASLILE